MFATDATDLNPREATTYRTKVLYMSNERPDAQAVIQNLSSRAAKPTAKAMKLIKHLVGYLWGTQGYGVTFAWPQARQVSDEVCVRQAAPRRSTSTSRSCIALCGDRRW